MPLLEWLERCALPEECQLADAGVRPRGRGGVPATGWPRPGPPPRWCSAPTSRRPWTCSSPRRPGSGCGSPVGLVVSDRSCPTTLLTTPRARVRRGGRAGRALARRRPQPLRRHPAVLAVRAATSCSTPAPRARGRAGRVVHLARQREPGRGRRGRRAVRRAEHYVDTYDRHGLLGEPVACSRTTCTPTDAELAVLAARGAAVAHCPTSNAALGSGLFPLRRHVEPRRAGGAGLRRRRRHRLLAASRRACRPTSCSRCSATDGHPLTPDPPAPPGHPGRRAGARARRPGR